MASEQNGEGVKAQRNDDWANLLTGVGTPDKDNRMAWVSFASRKPQFMLEQTWRGGGLAARVVELPAGDMTREGGVVRLGDGLQEEEDLLKAEQASLNTWPKFRQAICYARAYGGGAIIMAVDDGMDWSMPVNEGQIRSVAALHLATPAELPAARWYTNPWKDGLNDKPSCYRWTPWAVPSGSVVHNMMVHETRVLSFLGPITSPRQRLFNLGWGDSVLARVEQRIADTMSAILGASVLVQDFGQAVLAIDGLAGLLADPQGKEKLQRRLEYMRMSRSSLGFLIIDKAEQYDRQQTPVAGLADLIDRFYMAVAVETGIPKTILTGQAEAGLGDNTSPMSKVWQAVIRADQMAVVSPAWERLTRYQLLAKNGPMRGAPEPTKWTLSFNSLEFMTKKERADLAKVVAETDTAQIANGVYTQEEAARSHYSGAEFNPEVTINLEARKALAPLPSDFSLLPPESLPTAGNPPPAAANGEVLKTVQGILESYTSKKLGRSAALAMLSQPAPFGMGMPQEMALTYLGAEEPGTPAAPAPAPVAPPPGPFVARSDDVEEYVSLLVREVRAGELSAEEVVRKLARLYRTSVASARALFRSKMESLRTGRADTDLAGAPAGLTHFPRRGKNKPVSLQSSEFPTFDLKYAAELREDWPELWGRSGTWDRQYERLQGVARGGGGVQIQSEEMAVRLREAWGRTYGSGRTLSNVLAQVKHLVVGKLGEAGMKQLLEQEKDRIRTRRKEAAAA